MSLPTTAKNFPLLEGANAIVTGAAQGLGFSIAKRYAECGARVFLLDMQADKVKDAARLLPGQGHEAFACDITDETQRAQTVQQIESIGGHIDILVNNAGIHYHSPIEDIEKDKWYRLIDVNMNAILFMSQVVGRVMIRQRRGNIINISSISGLISMPRRAAYVTAKTAVLGITRTLAIEWAKYGIRANAICPGYFATPMVISYIESGDVDEKEILRHIPMGKLGPMDAIGDACVFLASPLAEYVTGHTLVVDGGWTAFGAPEDAS